MNYPVLQKILNFDTAIQWLQEDSKDDFFPDAFDFRDVVGHANDFIERTKRRRLQVAGVENLRDSVPKKNLMLREAIWLPPEHRLLYLAILRHLLPKLDPHIPNRVYSYRYDKSENQEAYPFPQRMDRWKDFHNDFRLQAILEDTQCVLVSDIASFYDHISCRELCDLIRTLLGESATDEDCAVIDLLRELLLYWYPNGYGLPQNVDASSFFGSLYLIRVDKRMVGNRYEYFRWVDDIRICVKNERQAVHALHELQQCLAEERLFLASDKTRIVAKGTDSFNNIVDVADDKLISEIELAVKTRHCPTMKNYIPVAMERLDYHAAVGGDDRKFRAYANRLLDIGDFEHLAGDVLPKVQSLVAKRMKSHPDRSDYWCKMLSADFSDTTFNAARWVLGLKSDYKYSSPFNWQRYHVWRMLTMAPNLPDDLLAHARKIASQNLQDLVTSQAIMCLGKHGNDDDREDIYRSHFSHQKSYVVRRSVLIAIQQLSNPRRDSLYDKAITTHPEYTELIAYLKNLDAPRYGPRGRAKKQCADEPVKVNVGLARGVGYVDGELVRFRLSKKDYDYE